MVYFSATSLGFYPDELRVDHESSGTWPDDAVELTDEEAAAYWKQSSPSGKLLGADSGRPVWVDIPGPSPQEAAGLGRAWRNAEISTTQWLVERHRDQVAEAAATTLSGAQYAALLVYRQELRDWPSVSGFPATASQPVAPDWLAAAEVA